MNAMNAGTVSSDRGDSLRARISQHRLIPYERLTSTSETQAVGKAEAILKDGWRRLNHPPVKLDRSIAWDEFTPTTRSWNFHLNCWDLLNDLLAAHSSTGETKYLMSAVSVALDWVRSHPTVDGSTGAHAWYDMAVGLRAYRLAYIIDAGAREPLVTDIDFADLLASLEHHRMELADDDKIATHNNHGFYQVAGQLAMARRFGPFIEAMAQSLAQAKARFVSMLDGQFTDEGVHREHSPDYHRMVYDTLKGIVDSKLLDDPQIEQRVNLIEQSLSWFILPNGYLANFGDSEYRLCSINRRAVDSKWRTPEMRFVTSRGSMGSLAEGSLKAFPKSGYVVIREQSAAGQPAADDYYLAQTACFHSRTHKHADDLSIIWFDRGTPILVDAGKYGYIGKTGKESDLWKDGFWYSDPNRVYCESTRAHNTVEIDGKNYARKGVKPYGSALNRWGRSESGVFFTESEVKHFKSIRHVRLLFFKPGQWLIVCDWVHDNHEVEHEYRQWFHFAPEHSVRKKEEHYSVSVASLRRPMCATSLLPGVSISKPFIGVEQPQAQGWWSPKDKVMLPNYAVAFEQTARTGLFATVLSFESSVAVSQVSRIAPSGRSGQLRWTEGAVAHAINFVRPEDGGLQVEYSRR